MYVCMYVCLSRIYESEYIYGYTKEKKKKKKFNYTTLNPGIYLLCKVPHLVEAESTPPRVLSVTTQSPLFVLYVQYEHLIRGKHPSQNYFSAPHDLCTVHT